MTENKRNLRRLSLQEARDRNFSNPAFVEAYNRCANEHYILAPDQPTPLAEVYSAPALIPEKYAAMVQHIAPRKEGYLFKDILSLTLTNLLVPKMDVASRYNLFFDQLLNTTFVELNTTRDENQFICTLIAQPRPAHSAFRPVTITNTILKFAAQSIKLKPVIDFYHWHSKSIYHEPAILAPFQFVEFIVQNASNIESVREKNNKQAWILKAKPGSQESIAESFLKK